MISRNARATIVYVAAIIGLILGFAIGGFGLFELYHESKGRHELNLAPFAFSGFFLLISAAVLYYDAVAKALEALSQIIPLANIFKNSLRIGGRRKEDVLVTEETEIKKEGEEAP